MIAAGVNAKALQTFMGHSSITVTLDRYGHLFGSPVELGVNRERVSAGAPAEKRVPGFVSGRRRLRTI
jgi:hypothetical protein